VTERIVSARREPRINRRGDDGGARQLERYGYRDLGWFAEQFASLWLAELILLWRNRRVFLRSEEWRYLQSAREPRRIWTPDYGTGARRQR